MDIKQLEEARAAEEVPTRVVINNKSGDPYKPECHIMVKGNDAQSVRDAVRAISRRLLADGKTEMDPDTALDSRIEKAVAACPAWGGFTEGVAVLECTPKNLARFFEWGHILAQVEAVMREHEAFSAAQSAS